MTLHQMREHAFQTARRAGLTATQAREVSLALSSTYRSSLQSTRGQFPQLTVSAETLDATIADVIRLVKGRG